MLTVVDPILATRPGDTSALERRLAARDGTPQTVVRAGWYDNLRALAEASGVMNQLPGGWRTALSPSQ